MKTRLQRPRSHPSEARPWRRLTVQVEKRPYRLRTDLLDDDLPRLPALAFHCTRGDGLKHLERGDFHAHAANAPDPSKHKSVLSFLTALSYGIDSISLPLQFASHHAGLSFLSRGSRSFGPHEELPLILAAPPSSMGYFLATMRPDIRIIALPESEYSSIAALALSKVPGPESPENVKGRLFLVRAQVAVRFFREAVRLYESIIDPRVKPYCLSDPEAAPSSP